MTAKKQTRATLESVITIRDTAVTRGRPREHDARDRCAAIEYARAHVHLETIAARDELAERGAHARRLFVSADGAYPTLTSRRLRRKPLPLPEACARTA